MLDFQKKKIFYYNNSFDKGQKIEGDNKRVYIVSLSIN